MFSLPNTRGRKYVSFKCMTLFPSSRDEAQGANKTKCSKPLSKHMINDDCQLKGTKIVTESNSQARLGGVSEIMLIEIRNCG